MTPTKFQRIPHLPWSPGKAADDLVTTVPPSYIGNRVIVTEKLDGENTSMYHAHFHARSTSSSHHPSRSLVKSIWARVKNFMPDGEKIVGENVFAAHSIPYTGLPTPFLAFALYRDGVCQEWDPTVKRVAELFLTPVPVLYDGIWDEATIKALYTGKSVFGGEQEGYIVRNATGDPNFTKYVRANHVQTDEHWLTNWTPNGFKNG